MYNLLKIEWLKIKNYKAFIIISIFFAIGVIASNYIVHVAFANVINQSKAGALIARFNPFDFYYTWQTTSYTSGWLLLLPALLIVILVTNEFTYRTNRQNIIDGWSREEFINVKMAMPFIFAVCSTVLVFLTALVFALFSGSEWSFHGFSHIFFFFVKALSYNLLAVLIAVWVRRTGFAIGIYFIYLGAENLISNLLMFWSIRLKAVDGIDVTDMGDYLPMNASDGLLSFPDNSLKSLAKSSGPTELTYLVMALALAYIILFYWLGRRSMQKRDL